MKTHTPGPWGCPNWFNKMTGCWPVNLPSGQIEVRTDNGLADAKLTAAAPELLLACQQAAATFERMAMGDSPALIPEAREILAEAIKKAKGQP